MVNPVDLITKSPEQVNEQLERYIADGADDLAIWYIDPAFGPD